MQDAFFLRNVISGRALSRARWATMAAASMLMLAGCAAFAPKAPELEVRERAQARWDALIAGNWEKAYSYSTPAYRKAVDLFGFRARSAGPVKLKSAEVVNARCRDLTCEVTVRVGFAPLQRGYPETFTDLEDRWVLESGDWWRYERF